MTVKTIGLLAGAEPALTEALQARFEHAPSVRVRPFAVAGLYDGSVRRCDVVFDRLSGRIPSYRRVLARFALDGGAVVNDPFASGRDDPTFALAVARHLGFRCVPTVLLPQRAYPSDLPSGALAHLPYPLPWSEYLAYVGVPAVLVAVPRRDIVGVEGGATRAVAVHDLETLWRAYDELGERGAILRAAVPPGSTLVRAVCVDAHTSLMTSSSLASPGAAAEAGPPHGEFEGNAGMASQLVAAAQAIRTALGLDVSATTFAWAPDGAKVVVEAADPTPRFDPAALGPRRWSGVVAGLADLLVRRAHGAGGALRDRYPFGRALRRRPPGEEVCPPPEGA
ncbi:MAG: hypothetical protein AAGN82_18075 [Myxococcota bacterium]